MRVRIGGEDVVLEGDGSLYDALRAFGISSLRRGCPDNTCGACRVLIDGHIANSCAVSLETLSEGATIESYEDLANDNAAKFAVNAFENERPTRCRLCVPALAVTAAGLARAGRSHDPDAVEQVLESATCMCTGRGSLRRALLRKD